MPVAVIEPVSGSIDSCFNASKARTYRDGRWFVTETENFRICCELSEAASLKLAGQSERLRNELCAKWLGQYSHNNWRPRCEVVLHPTVRAYVSAVGRGSERTVGSSLIDVAEGRITSRRIDLLAESVDYLTALPHELTHVVLKDRFASSSLPRWADEGMAILGDTEAKQKRHERDLQSAQTHQTTFRAAELILMEDYPPPSRFGTFYGQSASLTRFLVARRGATEFVNFIEHARTAGFDNAARDCYGFANLGDLDRQWRESVSASRPASESVLESTPYASPNFGLRARTTESLVSR